MIRVLQVVSIMNAGGMENYIMNMYRIIDRTKVQFDFLVHHSQKGFFDDEITALGGKIYRCTMLDDKNVFKYISDLKRIFAENDYKIVHGHLSSLAFIYLGIAKQYHVPYRIAHSHGAGHIISLKGYAKYWMFKSAKTFANIRFACSKEAGEYLFGHDSFEVMPNGIHPERFRFNSSNREQILRQYGLEGCFVVGHVGRFNLQKNHKYLLKIFQKLYENEKNARLLLLGDGELKQNIISQVKQMGLEQSVIFAGVHKDCEKYYHAMDVFVLPSHFEGLPVTGIEAQYAGLPCLFADTISRETAISERVSFVGIREENLDEWVEKLLSLKDETELKNDRTPKINNDMYDVNVSAIKMQNRYIDMGGAK